MKPTAKSNDCQRIDEYLADGLGAEERLRYEAHLESCPACREEIAAQRAIDALLREGTGIAAGADTPMPVELAGRIETAWRPRSMVGKPAGDPEAYAVGQSSAAHRYSSDTLRSASAM